MPSDPSFRKIRTRAPLIALVSIALVALVGAARSASVNHRPDSTPAATEFHSGDGAAEIAIALRKLNTIGSVLYIAAHPDDENTALLAFLARERCVRTAYLSITRGDGGQNLIGTEQGPLIGLLRTQELLAARRIDRAGQFFTRAVDFGYSKSPEETLRIWGHEAVLSDVVRIIRKFQPDVIIARFPVNGAGGHGHHTASAILAGEAFVAAADNSKFPDQLVRNTTWKAERLFWNAWTQFPGEPADKSNLARMDIGAFNAMLGKSYTEIAGQSRSQHKSQGFGAPERRGSRLDYFQLLAGSAAAVDPLEGIDLSWNRIPGAGAVSKLLAQAEQQYSFRDPSAVVPVLVKAREEMLQLSPSGTVAEKLQELDALIAACAGLHLEAVASAHSTTPGETVKLTAGAVVRSRLPVSVAVGEITWLSSTGEKRTTLESNTPFRTEFNINIPAHAPFTEPYWLVEPPVGGLYTVSDPALIGAPESTPSISVVFDVDIAGAPLRLRVPVLYRWVDPVRGEQTRPLCVLPAVTGTVQEHVLSFHDDKSKTVKLTIRAGRAPLTTTIVPRVPEGWAASPEKIEVKFKDRDEEASVRFEVKPAAAVRGGSLSFDVALDGGAPGPLHSIQRIEHAHIPIQTVLSHAGARLIRTDLAISGRRIGYIEGAGDEGAAALAQMGYEVVALSDEDLDNGNFTNLDSIVAGVRAYNTRPRLKHQQKQLMHFVENGGTFVVQYNTSQDLAVNPPGPAPFVISRDRVTVEDSPVTFLNPDHPLLSTPNRITAVDFEHWVQERGLYFAQLPAGGNNRYETILSMADPGEPAKNGAILYLRHGRGVYIYTGLSFFRQLSAGVEGAWRLFANLVARRTSEK